MKVLIYSLNYAPELTGIGKYNAEMANWLVDNGDDVQVVSAKPYYPEWEVHEGFKKGGYLSSVEHGVSIKRCPLYVPATPTALKRILHLVSFAVSSAFVLFKKLLTSQGRPEMIFVVQPTLFITPIALLFAKLSGAKAVLHIQDYEVDAMLGLGMAVKNSLTARFAFSIESWLIRRFDVVSTISHSMMEKAKQKGVPDNKVMFFPNWADTEFVTPSVCGLAMREKWGFTEKDKVVLYAGNMGAKQGLEMVLEAAAQFQTQPEVKFVFVGAGAHVDALTQMAKDLQLNNVIFKPLQAWEDVPAMLSMANIHLVIQKKGAADAVLPSKLTNILSAGGKAIVTAEVATELGKIESKYPGIFKLVEPESLPAFLTALNLLLLEPVITNKVAREYAEQHLNKGAILSRFKDNARKLIG